MAFQNIETLGMDKDHIVCAYFGNPYTEWDHFHPLIKDKMPTGYISEIHNLVPTCGKCNQSKENQHWANCQALHDLMLESQKHSAKLNLIIKNTLSVEKRDEKFSTK